MLNETRQARRVYVGNLPGSIPPQVTSTSSSSTTTTSSSSSSITTTTSTRSRP